MGTKDVSSKINLAGKDLFSNWALLHLPDDPNLATQLVNEFGLSDSVAQNLAQTYGGQVWDVCKVSAENKKIGKLLVNDFPYIEEEVIYACKEYACTVEDILSRRTRLAFLNKDAAMKAIPRVAELMATQLGWTNEVRGKQIEAATKYIEYYSGNPER